MAEKAHEATSAVGSGMQALAGAIRGHTPHDGVLGTASSAVANSLENGARYLQEEGLPGMTQAVANVIRRNPLPSILVGIGIGFFLARTTLRK